MWSLVLAHYFWSSSIQCVQWGALMEQFQQYQLRSELQGHDEDVRICLEDIVLALLPTSETCLLSDNNQAARSLSSLSRKVLYLQDVCA